MDPRPSLPLATGTPLAQLGDLVSDRRFDLIDTAFDIDMMSARQSGDRARLGELQLTSGMHLQKMGQLETASRRLGQAARNVTDPGLRAEIRLYQAKLATQRGQHQLARRRYERLEEQLGQIPTLDEEDRLARVATTVWRAGHSALLSHDRRGAREAFARHADLAAPGSNQAVNHLQYGQTFPVVLDSDASLSDRIDRLDHGIEATGLYPAMSLTARFTFPGVAQLQKDVLASLRCKLSDDPSGMLFHTWRLCLALDEFRAGPRTESVGEVWDVLIELAPEVASLLVEWSSQRRNAAVRLASSIVGEKQAFETLRAAKEDYQATPPGPFPQWSRPARIVRELAWERLDATSFERLMFNILVRMPAYRDVSWNTKTYANDGGKDMLASCWRETEHGVVTRQLVAIEAKHRPSSSLSRPDVHEIVLSADSLSPPVDALVIATSGQVSGPADAYVNQNPSRLPIELWTRSRLEYILANMPDLVEDNRLAGGDLS